MSAIPHSQREFSPSLTHRRQLLIAFLSFALVCAAVACDRGSSSNVSKDAALGTDTGSATDGTITDKDAATRDSGDLESPEADRTDGDSLSEDAGADGSLADLSDDTAESDGLVPDSTAPQLLAGFVALEITPPIGVPLAGFGGGKRRDIDVDKFLIGLDKNCVDPDPTTPYTMFNPSEGVIDPLRVKVFVLKSGERAIVIVGLDLIGSNQEMMVDLALGLKLRGVEQRDIMLTATHTHSGPGAMSIRRFWEMAAADCFNQSVYDAVKAKVVSAANLAFDALKPARIGWRHGTIEGVQRNRRGNTGHFDNTLTVLHVQALDGSTLGTIVSLPIHATALGESNMKFSSDLTGAVERELQSQLGGVAIFLQKPEGDVSPVLPAPGVEGMTALGQSIAKRAVELLPTSYHDTLPLATAQHMHDFGQPFMREGCSYPGAFDLCDAMPNFELTLELTETWFPQKIPITLSRIGPLLIVGLPGEPTTSVGEAIRDALLKAGEQEVWLLALTNEHMGYVTTEAEYLEGGYESIATLYGQTTADKLRQAVLETLPDLK